MKLKKVTPLNDGLSERESAVLWDQIEKNAAYQFNASHATEYALISYWAMWLKVHHPLDFFAASMSILDDSKLGALLADASQHGIEVLPPNINFSSSKFEISIDSNGKEALTIPFNRVKNVSDVSARHIVEKRLKNGGSFASKEEFEALTHGRKCTSRAIESLDKVGAFADVEVGTLPARHPDRLKDQLDLMPELCATFVRNSRRLVREKEAVQKVCDLYDSMATCADCSLSKGVHPKPAFGKKAEIMVITDTPTKDEEKSDKMFSGDSSKFIKTAMREAGIMPSQGYFTALVKSPKNSSSLSNEQINSCVSRINEEVQLLKPATIVLLGNAAIKHFLPEIKKPKDSQGKVIYKKQFDANFVVGMNPATIWFDENRQNELDEIFRIVSQLI